MNLCFRVSILCLGILGVTKVALAEPEQTTGKLLPEVVIEAEEEKTPEVTQPLPDVDQGKIYSGKKTTVTELSKLPSITTNNYRQAFSHTAGLLTSEVGNEGLASFSYRGLGDPHESFNLNILRDGVPIGADLFGYPANYYQPPLDSIDRIEFVRGGSSLVYGPQVGGAINYVSRSPATDAPLTAETKQVFGERSLYSTYNQVSGSQDGVGYLGFFHHRQSDGFRKENSDYSVNNGDIKLVYKTTERAKWELGFDAYSGDHGESGGLTLKQGPGLASYNEDRFQSSVQFDRLQVDRYAPTLKLSYEADANTNVYATAFGGYYRRFSRRQTPGTADTFGGIYNGETNNIVTQEFRTVGLDGRVQHNWQLGEEKQTLALGTFFYYNDSPFRQELGHTPDSNAGDLLKRFSRNTFDAAIFAENKFVFGKLKVTPGVRVENIFQSIDEKVNSATPNGLRNDNNYQGALLPGLAVAYDLTSKLETYFNASTAYKPQAYQDSVPLNTGDTISGDLKPSLSKTLELGLRGNPTHWFQFDTSAFAIFFDDQFGRVGTNIQNVGSSRTLGYDVSGELGAFGLLDRITQGNLEDTLGSLQVFGNASILHAEFDSGPLDGKTPQYAPDYLIRTGLNYRAFDAVKMAFQGTLVDNHYADDADSSNFAIPSYAIWDLTAETSILNKRVSFVAGVNNIFDKAYYARIRSNGIDPGLPRNVYGGMIFRF